MKTHPLMLLLACAVMPVIIFAQQLQQAIIKQSQHDKYPGGVYARWDSVAKKYNWYSLLNGNHAIAGVNQQNSGTTNIADAIDGNLFHLVKDINNATDGNPGNYQPQFYYQHYAILNGVAYFAADDGIHGAELWRSDGTDAGTYLLKDIEPGAGSSGISNITAANGKIYFSATTTANGAQPWISDGTANGTVILKDISSTASGYPEMYTAVKNKVYFITGRSALWVTDGTEAGTTMLINDTYTAGNLAQPVAVGNKLFFTASSYQYGSRQLWRSDGTVAGTFIPKVNFSYYYPDPQQLTAYKGKLYFTMPDEYGYARTIWSSDGTEAGTTSIYNSNGVTLPYYDGVGTSLADVPFTIMNGTFYFVGVDSWNGTGIEMFKYNPEGTDGILLVKDITPGWDGTNIQPFDVTVFKDNLYFKVINTDGSASLWKSNGDDAGTKAIKNFASINQFTFYGLYSTPASLFFEAYTTAKGFELWKSDGTNAGTQIAADVFPGIYSSYPYNYTAMGPGLIFSARGKTSGYELWGTDGSSITKLVKDINTTTSQSSQPHEMIPVTGGAMFSAYDVLHGFEPFYSDGTDAGTNAAGDILPGDFSSNPYAFKTVGNDVYFIVNYDENNLQALCRYNSSTKQMVKLYEVPSGYSILKKYAVADNGIVFFQMVNYGVTELWRTDGTVAGSFILKQGNYYYWEQANEIITLGNTAYLGFNDPYYGNELYKSDGTVSGTKIVNDLNAGSQGSNPYDFIVYKGAVYFAAYDEDNSTYLYTTNGSFAGTKKIKAITPVRIEDTDRNMSRAYCISNGVLFIHTYDYYSSGDALWKSDGTTAGTKQVRMIGGNHSYASINNLTDVNGLVYFSANDGIYGNELWASNGTLVGTTIIKDITPGSEGSDLQDFCSANGMLYFLNNGAVWQSNGPGSKTKAMNDGGLSGVSGLHDLLASGNSLFIGGYTQATGDELYVADVTQQRAIAKQTQNLAAGKLSFNASISPNPVHDMATLQLPNVQHANIVLVDNTGKTLWQQTSVNKTQLQIPMQQFASGVYFVKISSDNKEQTIKIIKE